MYRYENLGSYIMSIRFTKIICLHSYVLNKLSRLFIFRNSCFGNILKELFNSINMYILAQHSMHMVVRFSNCVLRLCFQFVGCNVIDSLVWDNMIILQNVLKITCSNQVLVYVGILISIVYLLYIGTSYLLFLFQLFSASF